MSGFWLIQSFTSTLNLMCLLRQVSLMYYRADVFEAHNLSVPNTWDELLTVVSVLNGSDFSGDALGDFAACFQLGHSCPNSGTLLEQILAPLTQYQVRHNLIKRKRLMLRQRLLLPLLLPLLPRSPVADNSTSYLWCLDGNCWHRRKNEGVQHNVKCG